MEELINTFSEQIATQADVDDRVGDPHFPDTYKPILRQFASQILKQYVGRVVGVEPSTQQIPKPLTGLRRVVLVGVPVENRVKIVKAIRNAAGITLVEAIRLSDNLPAEIVTGVGPERAIEIAGAIQRAGGLIEIRPE